MRVGLDKWVYGVSDYSLPAYFRLSIKYVAISQHGPLSLYTNLKDPSTALLDLTIPWDGLWMIFLVMALASYVKQPFA